MLSLLKLIPTPWRIGIAIGIFVAWTSFVGIKGYSAGKAKGDAAIAALVHNADVAKIQFDSTQSVLEQKLIIANLSKVDTIRVRTTKNVEVTKEIPGPIVTVHDTVTRVELPFGWLSVYNASARGDLSDSASATNGTASGLTPNNALGFVVQNNGICEENANRLKSLQAWIVETRLNVDSVNAAAKKRKH